MSNIQGALPALVPSLTPVRIGQIWWLQGPQGSLFVGPPRPIPSIAVVLTSLEFCYLDDVGHWSIQLQVPGDLVDFLRLVGTNCQTGAGRHPIKLGQTSIGDQMHCETCIRGGLEDGHEFCL